MRILDLTPCFFLGAKGWEGGWDIQGGRRRRVGEGWTRPRPWTGGVDIGDIADTIDTVDSVHTVDVDHSVHTLDIVNSPDFVLAEHRHI